MLKSFFEYVKINLFVKIAEHIKMRWIMKKYDAIVVGSGCAGLAASLEMIISGKKTLLIEKHNLPGGCASSFCRGRFEFEPSLHELCGVGPESNPGGVRKLFADYGVEVKWQRVDDCFRCISTYSDGSPMDVTLPAGVDAFISKTEEYVPGSREKMTEFFELLREINELTEYLESPKISPSYLLKSFGNVFRTAGYSSEEVFDAIGLPQKCKDILSVYWSYLGVDMKHLSFFHYASMVYSYVTLGAYIPSHTSHEISNAMLERFRSLGGEIMFNCRAEEFLFDGDRCCGVKTNAGDFYADVVFANINPDIIYGKMMPKNLVPAREKKLSAARNRDFGARMFTVYLGLNKSAQELGIKDYSIFLADSADSVREFNSMKKTDTNNYSIFLCYNLANPASSPEGTAMCSFTTMFTSAEDWNNVSDEEYFRLKNRIAKKIINNFEDRTGISLTPYIEEISVASPLTFARYLGVPEGSVYGYMTKDWDSILSRTVSQAADFPIKGLKPIGTSGLRGDGYSSAYMCGSIVAKAALKELNEKGGNK